MERKKVVSIIIGATAIIICFLLVALLVIPKNNKGLSETSVYNTATNLPSSRPVIPTGPVIENPDLTVNVLDYTMLNMTDVSQKGGTNMALNKTVTVSGKLSNDEYKPENAVDGDPNTIWISASAQEPWLIVDLGEAKKIGRIELVARQDGDRSSDRFYMEIRGSNDPNFETSEYIAARYLTPYESKKSWAVNSATDTPYRYIRIQRTNNAGAFALAEFRVINEPINEELAYDQKPDNAKMIISRCNGYALTANGHQIGVDHYNFIQQQWWLLEQINDNNYFIKNVKQNLYLEQQGNKLVLAEKSDTASQHWTITEFEAEWNRIANVHTGNVLVVNGGCLAICSGPTEDNFELWDISNAYIENVPHSSTVWMEGKYGIMMHLLPAMYDIKKGQNQYCDVKKICDQIEEAGADFFLLSVGQNSGVFNARNEKLSSIVTIRPEKRATERDFIQEFGEELKARGIKLMLYTSVLPPNGLKNNDTSDWADMLMTAKDDTIPYVLSTETALFWSMFMREYSLRYGDLISGWWLDRSEAVILTDSVLTIYANALKAGNPDAVITFNQGVRTIQPFGPPEDFTSGETNYPFGAEYLDPTDRNNWVIPKSSKVASGAQWFMLTFASTHWQNQNGNRPLYEPEMWGELAKTITERGGTFCLDLPFDKKEGYTFTDLGMDIMMEIKRVCKD